MCQHTGAKSFTSFGLYALQLFKAQRWHEDQQGVRAHSCSGMNNSVQSLCPQTFHNEGTPRRKDWQPSADAASFSSDWCNPTNNCQSKTAKVWSTSRA